MKGRYVRKDGYVRVVMRGHPRANKLGRVYEHILVAERMLARPLLPGETVHHRNENPSDNHPDNLIIYANQGEHLAEHARLRLINAGGNPETDKICSTCQQVKAKSEFSPTSNGRLSYDCKSCAAARQRERRLRNGSGSTNTDRG